MKKNKPRKNSILEGTPLSDNDLFFIEWGKETLKENISVVNEVFKLFITLNTILLSTYLGLYNVVSSLASISHARIIPAICIIFSLTFSILGIYPFSIAVDISKPEDIKKYKQKRLAFKKLCLSITAFFLVGGFIALLILQVFLSK